MKETREQIQQIEQYAGAYDIVPVRKEIFADVITPISLLRKLAVKYKRFYLLESVEGGEKWGRYSFLGYNPIMRVTCRGRKVAIESDDGREELETDDALGVVRDILKKYRSPKLDDMPPFTGGFVGYFAYAVIAHAEPVLRIKRGDFADFDLMLFDKVIAYDQLKQKMIVVVNVRTKGDIHENYGRAIDEVEEIINLIHEDVNIPEEPPFHKAEFTCNVTKEEYADMVERTKEYIREGDIFQAVISRRFASRYEGSLINPYRVLRTTNPSPYMVYMNMDDVEIMSTSPETPCPPL